MDSSNQEKTGWRQKVSRETLKFWFNFVYLAIFFGVFTWYRRLILAQYGIAYEHYGFAIVEALILAKVILVGDFLRLGSRFEEKPLIFSTLYKTLWFSLFVGAFSVLEKVIEGLVRGKGWAAGFDEVMREGKYELLARCLLTFFTFIPFFAFKELGRVIGKGKLGTFFFARR